MRDHDDGPTLLTDEQIAGVSGGLSRLGGGGGDGPRPASPRAARLAAAVPAAASMSRPALGEVPRPANTVSVRFRRPGPQSPHPLNR